MKNDVKQGCVLAPTLFCIYFALLLGCAFGEVDGGIRVITQLYGSLFNIARLRVRTKPMHVVLCRELLFADNAAFVAHDE